MQVWSRFVVNDCKGQQMSLNIFLSIMGNFSTELLSTNILMIDNLTICVHSLTILLSFLLSITNNIPWQIQLSKWSLYWRRQLWFLLYIRRNELPINDILFSYHEYSNETHKLDTPIYMYIHTNIPVRVNKLSLPTSPLHMKPLLIHNNYDKVSKCPVN